MAEFDQDSPEDRLVQEAEELMRQRRYGDAVTRYQTLRRQSPTDMWAGIGYVSALECAGRVDEAEKVLDGTLPNDRWFVLIHCADETVDWTTKEALEMAQPMLGISNDREAIELDIAAAVRNPAKAREKAKAEIGPDDPHPPSRRWRVFPLRPRLTESQP